MLGRFALGFGRTRERALTAGKVAFAVSLLAGCSSVPDAVNPVAWFDGKDDPAVATPVPGQGAEATKTADTARDVVKGLPADKGNSKYAAPVRREVAPTKPLARRTPAPADTQVAAAAEAKAPPKPAVTKQELAPPPSPAQTIPTPVAAPTPVTAPSQVAAAPEVRVPPKPVALKQESAPPPVPVQGAAPQVAAAPEVRVPPKPVVTAQELAPPPAQAAPQVAQADPNRVSPDRRAPQARDDGPSAPPANVDMAPPPPANVDMAPPPPANVPETVPVARSGRGKPLQDQFQRRLAESAQQTLATGVVDMPRPALASGTGLRGEEEPIHLVPPSTGKRGHKGGGKGLAAPAPEPAASFQVASLDFRANSNDLTAADRTSIAEVARLYRQTGGVVRVVGHAPAPGYGGDAVSQMMDGLEAAMRRANAVARELTRRGVPAGKIMVGADPAGNAIGGVGAQVYIDVL